MHLRRRAFLAALGCGLPAGLLLLPRGAATMGSEPDDTWFFFTIETKAYRAGVEVSSANPEERRWYISNLVQLPSGEVSYGLRKKMDQYFEANVVEPAKKRGVALDYYEQDVMLNGGSVVGVSSREQGQEMRDQEIADRKEQSGNIYSFNFVFGPAKGEETSQPRLIYRDKEQPSY